MSGQFADLGFQAEFHCAQCDTRGTETICPACGGETDELCPACDAILDNCTCEPEEEQS